MSENNFCYLLTFIFVTIAIIFGGEIHLSVVACMCAICSLGAYLGIGNKEENDTKES